MVEKIEFTVDGREFEITQVSDKFRWSRVVFNGNARNFICNLFFDTPAEAQQSAINYVMKQKGK